MALYSEKVMDHFYHPRNVGVIENADGIGEVGNPKCGDIMKVYLKVNDGVISDVKFNTFGCGSAIATSSMATELIKGKPVEEALELSNQAVVEATKVFAESIKSRFLNPFLNHQLTSIALNSISKWKARDLPSFKDYYEKNGIEYDHSQFANCETCPHCGECGQ